MKIAFLGTHGVGKTTLCFDVASRLKRLDIGVDIVKEVARSCPLPINQDTTLDSYAYLVHAIGRQSEYDSLVREWVRTYGGLFKVPILQKPSFDGTRALSSTFQLEIDGVIDELVAAFGVRCHQLDPDNRPGWVDTVLLAMDLPLEPPQTDLFNPD